MAPHGEIGRGKDAFQATTGRIGRMVVALKDLEIRALKPRERVYKQADERGLYIEVHPGGSKLWRMKFRFLGRDKRIAFGSYPEVGLAEARRRRDEARQQVRDGIDPTAERRREKLLAMYNAASTFGEVAEEYIKKMIAEGRAEATTTKASWLLEQLEPIARNAIADLKPVEVLAALKRIEAKGKHETARRCRSFASRVFRYGVATGRGETDPTSVLRVALVTPKVQHHGAVLDPDAVGEMLRAVDAYSGHLITRLALQISPHVMARPGELRQAQWPEFDLEKAVWKVPPERMKMRRPHAIPLSRQVLAYLTELNELTGPAGFVFPAFHTLRDDRSARIRSTRPSGEWAMRLGRSPRMASEPQPRRFSTRAGNGAQTRSSARLPMPTRIRSRHLQPGLLLGGARRHAPVVERLSG